MSSSLSYFEQRLRQILHMQLKFFFNALLQRDMINIVNVPSEMSVAAPARHL